MDLKNNVKCHLKKLIKYLIIAFVLEITIFNFNAYRLFFGKFTEEKIDFNSEYMQISGAEYTEKEGVYELKEDKVEILLKNPSGEFGNQILGKPVGNVKLGIDLYTNKIVNYQIGYKDSSSKDEFKILPMKSMQDDVEISKYTTMFLNGNVEELKIILFPNEGQTIQFKINDITLNKQMPININLFRILIITSLLFAIYCFKNVKAFNIPYDKYNYLQSIAIYLLIVFTSLVFLYTLQFTGTNMGSYYSVDFVNALKDGNVSLNEKPDEELLELENPYDYSQRVDKSVDYIFDCALYNGNYYVYFGILPVLLEFLPYNLMTGNYLSLAIGGFVFIFITLFVMLKLIMYLYKKYMSNMPFKYLIFSYIFLVFGSFLLWMTARIHMYEVCVASGLMFAMYGLVTFLEGIEEKNIKYSKLVIGATSLALSVACRPTFLLVSIIIIPSIISKMKEKIKLKENKNLIKLLLCICIPYAIIGITLMIYNYIRFDSIFEFGAKYQLTINDMTKTESNIFSIPTGILTMLFRFPNFTTTFPFITYTTPFEYFGYTYCQDIIGGVFWFCPILFVIFGITKIKSADKKMNLFIRTVLIVALIMCILNVFLGGLVERYVIDYLWLLIVVAILLISIIYNKIKDEKCKKIFMKFIGIIALYTLVIGILSGTFLSEEERFKNVNPEEYKKVEQSIMFTM